MAVSIESPTDGQTGTPNPIAAQGTADLADGDYIQIRWERSGGTVWNGAQWSDDDSVWEPSGPTTPTVVYALPDLDRFDRISGTDAKFSFEWDGMFVAGATGGQQLLGASRGSTQGAWHVWLSSAEDIRLSFYAADDTLYGISTNAGPDLADKPILIRGSLDLLQPTWQTAIKLEASIDNGATWIDLIATANETASNTSTFENLQTVGLRHPNEADGFPMGCTTLTGLSSTHMDAPGYIRSASWTAHNGDRIVDVNFARDVDAGHDVTTVFSDAVGNDVVINQDVGGGHGIIRTRLDNWFTVHGLEEWEAVSPSNLQPIPHTLVARAVNNGVPGTPVEHTFTPVRATVETTGDDRYVRRGTGRVFWAVALADPTSPTITEIAAAYDLTCDLADEVTGLQPVHETIDLERVNSPHDVGIIGVAPVQRIGLTFLDRVNDGLTTRTLFTAGAAGYLILAPYGHPGAGDRVDVIPVASNGWRDSWSFALQPAVMPVALTATEPTIRATVTY